MLKIVNVRNIIDMTPERLIQLAKDTDTVYTVWNARSFLEELYRGKDYLDPPDYEECWRVRPLYKIVKSKGPDLLERYCLRVRHGEIALFRIRD